MFLEKLTRMSKSLAVVLSAFLIALQSFGQPSNCTLSKNIPIKIYGETHDSKNSNKLWSQLLREANGGKTKLLLEAMQSEANLNLELKRELLSWVVPNVTHNLVTNVYGIDSEALKRIDVFGASYLIIRDGGNLGEHMLRALVGTLAEPQNKKDLLSLPFNEKTLDQLRLKILKTNQYIVIEGLISMTSPKIIGALSLFLHTRATDFVRTTTTDFHSTPVLRYPKSGDDYLNEGMPMRDRHMARQIHLVACQASQPNGVAVIVGQNHLNGLKIILPKIMPGYRLTFINIDPK